MKFQINFDDLESFILKIDDTIERLEIFCDKYCGILEQIAEKTISEAFNVIYNKQSNV